MYVFIFLIKVFKNHIVVLLNLANPDLKWVVLISPSDLLVRFCIEKIKEMNEWKAFPGFVFGFPK